MPRKDGLKLTGQKEKKSGVVMLKISTLIATLGISTNFVFWLCVQSGFLTLTPENQHLASLVALVNMGSLIQFFIIFFIKLSATRK